MSSYHLKVRDRYTYRCSDPQCAEKSGVVRTLVGPHIFPHCTWCGRLLRHVPEAPESRTTPGVRLP